MSEAGVESLSFGRRLLVRYLAPALLDLVDSRVALALESQRSDSSKPSNVGDLVEQAETAIPDPVVGEWHRDLWVANVPTSQTIVANPRLRVGPPQGTEQRLSSELARAGYVGLYRAIPRTLPRTEPTTEENPA